MLVKGFTCSGWERPERAPLWSEDLAYLAKPQRKEKYFAKNRASIMLLDECKHHKQKISLLLSVRARQTRVYRQCQSNEVWL